MKREKIRHKSKDSSNFIIQGTILAVAGILVRVIGMLYRVPLAAKIGDEGMGYYSAAYSIYSILLIMSSYSLPIAVSKMIAARIGQNKYKNAQKILKASLFYATLVGGIGAAVMWFGADHFAKSLKMEYSSYALKTLAPTLWIMSYLGVLRGYFQGHGTMVPTAVSQIFEQIVNAIISLVAAGSLYALGLKANADHGNSEFAYAFGAAGGTIGTGAGALTALLLFVFLLFQYRTTMKKQLRKDKSISVESYSSISYTLCLTIVPIIISSVVYNISSVVDNYLFGNAMAALDKGDQIAAQWGIYMGKYHLLFNIPVAIANSLSSSLIPALARAIAEKKRKPIVDKVSMVVRFTMMIAIPSAVGLTVLAEPISYLLFRGQDNAMLIHMTMVGSAAVILFSLSTVTNAVLQGINYMRIPIRNALIALVIHIGLLSFFLRVLHLGIYSVLYSNILFALIVCLLNQFSIRRYLKYHQELKQTFMLPGLASILMGLACYAGYRGGRLLTSFIGNSKSNLFSTILAILIAISVYTILLLKLHCVSETELMNIPGGRRVVQIGKKLHLL